MKDDGLCPPNLFVAWWILRSQLGFDTQEVEGANSVLQTMAKAAPSIRHGLASDRMRIKLGDAISPAECCGWHANVVHHQATDEYVNRFAEGGRVRATPEAKRRPCEHARVDTILPMLRFALGAWRLPNFAVDLAWVWSAHAGAKV